MKKSDLGFGTMIVYCSCTNATCASLLMIYRDSAMTFMIYPNPIYHCPQSRPDQCARIGQKLVDQPMSKIVAIKLSKWVYTWCG